MTVHLKITDTFSHFWRLCTSRLFFFFYEIATNKKKDRHTVSETFIMANSFNTLLFGHSFLMGCMCVCQPLFSINWLMEIGGLLFFMQHHWNHEIHLEANGFNSAAPFSAGAILLALLFCFQNWIDLVFSFLLLCSRSKRTTKSYLLHGNSILSHTVNLCNKYMHWFQCASFFYVLLQHKLSTF